MKRGRVERQSWVVRLYPPAVSRRLGQDLEALLDARRRTARSKGVVGWSGYWLWLAWDLVRVWARSPGPDFSSDMGSRGSNEFQSRAARSWLPGDAVRDVRVAVRSLVRRPVFSLTVLATLSLTIGAATTIYSVVDWVLLRSLPYPDSDRLLNLGMQFPSDPYRLAGVSVPNLQDWRTGLRTIDGVAGATWRDHVLLGDGAPATLRGGEVTDGFFETIGATPAMGRGFGEADYRVGAARVMILSWSTWQDRFGGDMAIIGRSLRLRTGPSTVIGVMPRGFRGPETLGLGAMDVWTPFPMDDPSYASRALRPLVVIGRLTDDVGLEEARADLTRLTTALAAAYPEANRTREGDPWLGGAVLLQARAGNAVGRPLFLLLGSVGLLLLIGCVNVANLMLARGADRSRETAVRLAIGAGRRRVIGHVLTESMILAFLGGAVGSGLAWIGLGAFRRLAPADLPRLAEVAIDFRVLIAVLAISTATGLAFGLLPSIRISAIDPARGLTGTTRTMTQGPQAAGAWSGLLVLETALAFVLLVAAGLLFNSLIRLESVDRGFVADGVLRTRITPGESASGEKGAAFYNQVIDRITGRAGIRAAAFALNSPLESPYWRPTIVTETPAAAWTGGADAGLLTPGYFDVLGVPIEDGRDFMQTDGPDAVPVAIVNRSFADRAWPGMAAIGRRVRFSDDPDTEEPWRTVIGVVGDIRQNGLQAAFEPMIYVPFAQEPWPPSLDLLLLAGPDRGAAAAEVREAVGALDPTVPVQDLTSLDQRISTGTRPARLLAVLMTVFGALGMILAAVGLYGTTAYSVRVRRREFGIRVALGASAAGIAATELRRGAIVLGAGVSIGLVSAVAVSRILSGFLFDVHPLDPATLGLVTGVLLITGLASIGGPAVAASRLDPTRTLRED